MQGQTKKLAIGLMLFTLMVSAPLARAEPPSYWDATKTCLLDWKFVTGCTLATGVWLNECCKAGKEKGKNFLFLGPIAFYKRMKKASGPTKSFFLIGVGTMTGSTFWNLYKIYGKKVQPQEQEQPSQGPPVIPLSEEVKVLREQAIAKDVEAKKASEAKDKAEAVRKAAATKRAKCLLAAKVLKETAAKRDKNDKDTAAKLRRDALVQEEEAKKAAQLEKKSTEERDVAAEAEKAAMRVAAAFREAALSREWKAHEARSKEEKAKKEAENK